MFCNNCGEENSDGANFCYNCGSNLTQVKKTQKNIIIEKQAKSEDKEITFYSDDKGVRITNTRAIFGNKTYVMTNVSSISIGKQDPNWIPVIIIFLIAIIFLFISPVLGFIILIIGFVVLYFTRGKYLIKITSASGEADAFSDTNKEYIQNIVNAINEAIIKRG